MENSYNKMSVEEAKERIQYLESRPPYLPWIYTISALGNEFGEEVALDILMSRFLDEKPDEHRKKLQCRMRDISIATFVKMTNDAGYKVREEKYLYHKKAKKTSLRTGFKNSKHQKLITEEVTPKYRFDDDSLEERAGIMQFDGGLEKKDVEKQIIQSNPEILRQELVQYCVNKDILNKNLNPNILKLHPNYKAFSNGFRNKQGTVFELADDIGKGYAIITGLMRENNEGRIKRNNENWLRTDIITIDVDNAIYTKTDASHNESVKDEKNYLSISDALIRPLASKILLLYSTVNHSDNWNRFRVLFSTSFLISNEKKYKEVSTLLNREFHGDINCTDPARGFYGNSNAMIILPQEKVAMKYTNGCLTAYTDFVPDNLSQILNKLQSERVLIHRKVNMAEVSDGN